MTASLKPSDQYPHYIEFRHIYKTFDKPVLVDTNFHVDAGQTVAIIGRSGGTKASRPFGGSRNRAVPAMTSMSHTARSFASRSGIAAGSNTVKARGE